MGKSSEVDPSVVLKSIEQQFHELRNKRTSFRMALTIILENELWRCVKMTNLQPAYHDTFEDYVTYKLPKGLGTTMKIIRALADRYPDLVEMINKVTADVPGDVGAPLFNNNAEKNNKRNTSIVSTDSTDRIRGRLTKDGHDDLRALVDAGELSAHAAAIQVGYRKKKTTVSCVSPESAAKTLHRLCSDEFIFQLKQLL